MGKINKIYFLNFSRRNKLVEVKSLFQIEQKKKKSLTFGWCFYEDRFIEFMFGSWDYKKIND